jgi:hypothetical protein
MAAMELPTAGDRRLRGERGAARPVGRPSRHHPVHLGDDLEELVVTLEADHMDEENCLPQYAPWIWIPAITRPKPALGDVLLDRSV